MPSLQILILNHARALPEGALLCPSALLHLGTRAAVDKALSRLAQGGRLLRVCQGMYVKPIETRFGRRPPSVEKVIASLSALSGETIVLSGATAANALGLTGQVPVKPIYLTSGANRRLKLGELTVELRHAPRWQLLSPNRTAGDVIRALAWLGPQDVDKGLAAAKQRLSAEDLDELAAARAFMPAWIAEPVSSLVAVGYHPHGGRA